MFLAEIESWIQFILLPPSDGYFKQQMREYVASKIMFLIYLNIMYQRIRQIK